MYRKSFCNYGNRLITTTKNISTQHGFYRIALNVAISYYRKEKRRKEISNPYSEGLLNLADFQENTEIKGDTLVLQQFIADLKELDKALMLLYLEEKSHKEISEIIGITETNVATKIGRIKTVLKQKFSQVTT